MSLRFPISYKIVGKLTKLSDYIPQKNPNFIIINTIDCGMIIAILVVN
jgi:hypothetical protein